MSKGLSQQCLSGWLYSGEKWDAHGVQVVARDQIMRVINFLGFLEQDVSLGIRFFSKWHKFKYPWLKQLEVYFSPMWKSLGTQSKVGISAQVVLGWCPSTSLFEPPSDSRQPDGGSNLIQIIEQPEFPVCRNDLNVLVEWTLCLSLGRVALQLENRTPSQNTHVNTSFPLISGLFSMKNLEVI